MSVQLVPTTVLVVDDESEIRMAIAEVLEDEGFRVEMAANGEQALAALRDGLCPAVILLDLLMPVMDGRQFPAEQGADPVIAGIPVVVMSGSDGHGAAPPGTDFLMKPLQLDTLLRAVQVKCAARGDR